MLYNYISVLLFAVCAADGRVAFMKKTDAAVKRETLYVASWVLILSAIMEAVFLIINKWDYTVLLGNLLSGALAIFNFFLIGLTVQNAVEKDEKEAKNTIKVSQSLRFLMMLVVVAIGALLPCFNIWTSIIPLLFPRIAIAFWGAFKKSK